MTLISTISNLVANTVYPGNGTYASTLTITSSGAIEPVDSPYGIQVLGTGAVTRIFNAGTVGGSNDGIVLGAGGYISNTAVKALISGDFYGLEIAGTLGNVVNKGTITGNIFDGVYLKTGGNVTNSGTSALISSTDGNGIYVKGTLGAVTNAGTIAGGSFNGVDLNAGGYVTNSSTGTLSSAENAGIAIYNSSGSVNNAGRITGAAYGVYLGGAAGAVINASTIESSGGFGVYLESGGTVTNTVAGAMIYGAAGGAAAGGGPGGVTNTSTIAGGSFGIFLFAGGTVTNRGTTALISGKNYGVAAQGSPETVTNSGTITSSTGYGVQLGAGGIVTNSGTKALIFGGEDGVGIDMSLATVNNAGTITGGSVDGIDLKLGGDVTNSAGALISGGEIGVVTSGGSGILVNAGTINGSADAVDLQGGLSRLVADAGAVFDGAIIAAGTGNSLELARGTSANTGILGGIGETVTGFQTIDFDAGEAFTVEGNLSGLAARETINGFASADTLILDGFAETSFAYVSGTGIELAGTGTNAATIDITGTFTNVSFKVEDISAGTEILLCYLRGTQIATPAGQVPIEHINIGDAVITRFGGYRRVKWIGRQSYARRFNHDDFDQVPVKLLAGCWGQNLPKRDLSVSPGHSMLVGGVLVLARSLVNGITITQNDCPERVDYFQIEFETHDCILAEGVWSESYSDTPDLRDKFHNVEEFYKLYPAHVEPLSQSLCAPRPLDGPGLEAVLRQLLASFRITPGALHGCIDEISPSGLIRGWAWDEANPDMPVLLEIIAGRHMIGTILACDYREDLLRAGLGRGHSSFTYTAPAGALRHGPITIRRKQDHSEILAPANHNLKKLRLAAGYAPGRRTCSAPSS
jgi:hypothetical protein